MPIGHQRINDPKVRPNPSIVFIHVLERLPHADQALKILEALAAQFKPITKEWGFGVNSLREHEWNPEFAGRNWNAGEVIEIVLRRPDGSFAPFQFLLMVMAHELAHIKEMNHSNAFKKVNDQIRQQCAALRAKGYYGDGFWSSGKSLKYGGIERPLDEAEQPMYICDGARERKQRRRRIVDPKTIAPRGSVKKLGSTGRQTAIARKPGGRVKRAGAFEGEGHKLNDAPEASTFKKRANAIKAKDARALAAERRLRAEKRDKKVKVEKKEEEEDPYEEFDQLDSDNDGYDGGEAVDGLENDFDDAEWEYEDPASQLTMDEKRFLKHEMEDYMTGRGGGAVALGSGSGTGRKHRSSSATDSQASTSPKKKAKLNGQDKGKGKAKAEPDVIVIDDSD